MYLVVKEARIISVRMEDTRNYYEQLSKEQKSDFKNELLPLAGTRSVYETLIDQSIPKIEKLALLEWGKDNFDEPGMRTAAGEYHKSLTSPQDGSGDFHEIIMSVRKVTEKFDTPPQPKAPFAERHPKLIKRARQTRTVALGLSALATIVGGIYYIAKTLHTPDAEKLAFAKEKFGQGCEIKELEGTDAFRVITPDGDEYEIRVSNDKDSIEGGDLEAHAVPEGTVHELNDDYFTGESDFGQKSQTACYDGKTIEGTAFSYSPDSQPIITLTEEGYIIASAPTEDASKAVTFEIATATATSLIVSERTGPKAA